MQRVLSADLLEARVILQVIVPVRQPQTVLGQVEHVLGRVLRVLVHLRGIGRGDADAIQIGDQHRDLGLFLHRLDAHKLVRERFEPLGLDRRLVDRALRDDDEPGVVAVQKLQPGEL